MLPSPPPVPGPVVLVAIAYIVYHTAIRKTTYEDAVNCACAARTIWTLEKRRANILTRQRQSRLAMEGSR